MSRFCMEILVFPAVSICVFLFLVKTGNRDFFQLSWAVVVQKKVARRLPDGEATLNPVDFMSWHLQMLYYMDKVLLSLHQILIHR